MDAARCAHIEQKADHYRLTALARKETNRLRLIFLEDLEILLFQVETKRPFSSVTVTGTMTSFTVTRIGLSAFGRCPRVRRRRWRWHRNCRLACAGFLWCASLGS